MTTELSVGQGKVILSQAGVRSHIPGEHLAMQYMAGLLKYLIWFMNLNQKRMKHQ